MLNPTTPQILDALLALADHASERTFVDIWGPELGPAMWKPWRKSGGGVVTLYGLLTPRNRLNFNSYIETSVKERAAAVAEVERWIVGAS